MPRFNRSRTSVFNISYHIIWCPKYRKPYLHYYEKELAKYINEKANELNCSIENMEIMPDHVHIFIKCNTETLSVSNIVKYLKGYISYMIRKAHPSLKKYPAFWSPSYYCESIGHISEDTIKRYNDNQKINLKPSYKYKSIVKSSMCKQYKKNNN